METPRMTKSGLKILAALEELLASHSLDDITVSELVLRAGIARKSFYRSFEDKYDALNHWFGLFCQESFEKINTGERWEDALYEYLCVCEAKANVLIHAYESSEYGGLRQMDITLTEQTYLRYLLKKGVDIEKKETRFSIRFASCGGTDMVLEWLRGGMREDKRTLVLLLKQTLPKELAENLF